MASTHSGIPDTSRISGIKGVVVSEAPLMTCDPIWAVCRIRGCDSAAFR